jgi:tripartite-type tricarboxylate transporter receptor subunit TctC
MKRRRNGPSVLVSAFSCALLSLLSFAAAAQAYPTKPVRIILASSAGGPLDITLRAVADTLRQEMGQPIIIENQGAADGIIGAQAFARTAPDGYTLLEASAGPITLNPSIYPKLPYDPQADFTPIVMWAQFNSVIVANAGIAAGSLREMIAQARAKPGSLAFGSAGSASTSNMYTEWLRHAQKVDFYNVPYKSNPQALAAVAAGEVQATVFAMGGAQAQVRAGKAKILAAISEKRFASHPDIPTVKEEGLDIVIRNWIGFFGRTGTPRDIVDRWNRTIARSAAAPAFVQKVLEPAGMEFAAPSGESPEAFTEFLKRDRENYVRIKNEARLKIE